MTLHHSGSETTPQAVEYLHRHDNGPVEGFFRRHGFGQEYASIFGDVGYHFLIDSEGHIFEGRPLKYEGAHVSGHNPHNIGIVFLGNFAGKPLSHQQVVSGLLLMADLMQKYHITADQIFTHGQFDEKKHDELEGASTQIASMKSLLNRDMQNRASPNSGDNSGNMCRPYNSEAWLKKAAAAEGL